jgi:enediyne biosynthesis protein E4
MHALFRPVAWIFLLAIGLAAVLGAVLFFHFSEPDSDPATSDPAATNRPWFAEITSDVGLSFVHDAGPLGGYFMPQIIGSGTALFDFNNDGLLDIYLLHNGGPKGASNRLYQQVQGGRFIDASAGSGLDIAGYNMGVAVGDVNNDGKLDVIVTQYKGVKLFVGHGNGKFSDATPASGLQNPGWGCSAAFLDFDRDGWLDLVIVNYVEYDPNRQCQGTGSAPDYCGPNVFPGQAARLYRNRGVVAGDPNKFPRFVDVTEKSGLGALPGPGLGVVCADFDGDGWPDILAANDGQPNRLWINRHDGSFRDEAVQRGLAVNRLGAAEAGMGIALGDLTGTGRFDVFIPHLTEETPTLWRQEIRGLFQDQTAHTGLTRTLWRGTGFGTVLGDFDRDGILDLAVVNGRVLKQSQPANDRLGPHWSWYAERNQLFAGDGRGGFCDISNANSAFCATANVARGLAHGDIDNDGALDLLVTTVGGRACLYRNVAPQRGHWLMVRAIDPAVGGRDAYGAEIRLHAADRIWLGLANPGSSFLCSNDPRVHFGLGPVGHVDRIEVFWPDGSSELFPGCAADQAITLRKGEGEQRNSR